MSEQNKATAKPDPKGVKVITQQTSENAAGKPDETAGENASSLGNTNCGIC